MSKAKRKPRARLLPQSATTRLSREDFDWLESRARALGWSTSAFLRHLVQQGRRRFAGKAEAELARKAHGAGLEPGLY